MTHRILTALACATLLAASGYAEDKPQGKFLLSERVVGEIALDSLELHADGSCVVDVDAHTRVTGNFVVGLHRVMYVNCDTVPKSTYRYAYRLGTYTLTLTQFDGTEIVYLRAPEAPHPAETEITGIFFAHSDLGDAVTEVNPNHQFLIHEMVLDDANHQYSDITLVGTWTYADGVILYNVTEATGGAKEGYLRDFLVKRDAQGLWIMDPFHDNLTCETPSANLKLLTPPQGYTLVAP